MIWIAKKINMIMRRKIYVWRMFRAIKKARETSLFSKKASRTDALQCIYDFERVNKIPFDPSNTMHIDTITGMANCAGFHRRWKRILAKPKTITKTKGGAA